MKSIKIFMSGVIALISLSFVNMQKEVVRLENGNYSLNELKMEREDIEAIQKELEEMTKLITEDSKGGAKKDDKKLPDFDDLLTISESAKGFKNVLAFGAEEQHYAFDEEVSTNAIKQSFYYKYESKDDKNKEEFMSGIHDIMSKYL